MTIARRPSDEPSGGHLVLRALYCELKIPALVIGILWSVHSVSRLGGDVAPPPEGSTPWVMLDEQSAQDHGTIDLAGLNPDE